MGSIVNHRLEASTRGTDLLPGLHARIHDPLWLLARQWQLGELDGSDGGTPVSAALVTDVAPLTRWQPDGGQPAPYPGTVPLEALAESDGGPMPWRDTVGAGLRLARALRRAGISPARLIAAHPLTAPDPAVDPDVSPDAHATSSVTPGEVAAVGAVSAGRVPDPAAVAAAFDANRAALVSATGGAAVTVTTVLTAWRAWWDTRQPRPSGAWRPTELSYSFTAATDDPAAPLYSTQRFGGGMLDWTAFDVTAPDGHPLTPTATAPPVSSASPTAPGISAPASGTAPTAAAGTGTASAPAGVITRSIPVPVAFHGSAAGRYWQLEDASTDLGAIDTFPTELGKLLVAEFTACFAGDWYRLPVRVPYGSAVKIRALVTTDTFGSSVLVPSAGAADGPRPWRMFEHSLATGADRQPGPAADGTRLLIPPVLAGSVDSNPLEEVALARDPAADLVWGIENLITNAVGRPVRRGEDLLAQGRVPEPDSRDGLDGAWVWRMETTVPENWIPLLPTRGRTDDSDYLLVQGAMLRHTRAADGTLTSIPILPASLQLRPGTTLPEREIPSLGITLRRTRRLARGPDGSRLHWWSRTRSASHDQPSSGLAYDGLHTISQNPKAIGE